jgi:V/A-type H+-transporting ATPase subunit D
VPGKVSVNPNRMELLRLRRRLTVAKRGHKLLKEKFDELMKPFLAMIKDTRDLRVEVEAELADAYTVFLFARAQASGQQLEEALSVNKAIASVNVRKTTIVSISAPAFELEIEGEYDCYGLGLTPAVLDDALARFSEALPRMILLAEKENTLRLLAEEIEKTRRRVNALEYVLIPQLEDTIRFITMKLDEFERANLTRLMKIKEMVSES